MEDLNVGITKQLEVKCVEWFHGYGGNALGLKRAIPGLRSVAVCERDAFVVANMVSKMEKGLLDAVPIWTDVTDFPGCTGLTDQELEEIYGWMVNGTNRTDELRMCGNGVVPQTAEKAFRVLYEELMAHRKQSAGEQRCEPDLFR